ncbi:MAG: hypothetical protein ACPGGK_05455 [Pikeienuella sp.]
MSKLSNSRRSVLAGIAGAVGVGALGGRGSAAVLTPRAAEGPYYPVGDMRKPDTDNDLVKVRGIVEQAGGEVFTLRGTIRNSLGTPLSGLRIEIWQCDVDGDYQHTADRGSDDFDPAFQGFGHDVTDDEGRYVFRTIKPVIYPGRAPHIHVKVLDGKRELLTSQFYIRNHPNNARDFLFGRMSSEEADAVSMDFVSGADGVQAVVDVVVSA